MSPAWAESTETLNNSRKYTVDCEAVIIATGGFGYSEDMIEQYSTPGLIPTHATTNSEVTVGSGIKIGLAAGALLKDMGKIQLHPTAFINPTDKKNRCKILAPFGVEKFNYYLEKQLFRESNNLEGVKRFHRIRR